MNHPADPVASRRWVYHLLITVAVAAACGRILAAELLFEPSIHRKADDPPEKGRLWPDKRPEPMPTFSSNDRSRWATIHALVDKGTYVIGHRDPTLKSEDNKYGNDGIITKDGWRTIDVVLKPDTQKFYSSKPPLLPTLVAGEYWLLQKLFGWKIMEQPQKVVRTILLTVNVLPLLVYLLLLARLVERYGTTDWGRFYVLAAGCFGTLVTPFLVTLNNHTVAAFSALFALYAALRIGENALASGSRLNETIPPPRHLFILSGFFAGFTVCAELPALSFAGLLFLFLLVRAPWQTLAWFVPAAALPVAAFFLTNYLAIGQLLPAYSEFGGPWYEYEGSHWKVEPGQKKHGIDWAGHPQGANEGKATYAFHLLLGHHGLFSLTPVVLLAVAGMVAVLFGRSERGKGSLWPDLLWGRTVPGRDAVLQLVSGLALVLTVVVVGFYLIKSSNYGGWSSGPRWLMWLTPFWLLSMLPVVDWLAPRRWGRGLGYVLLGISVLSVSYPAWNPWRHPWLYNFMEAQGWIQY